ncbi:PREDICTED: protein Smaug [Papilio polytes]|uniref:protein Smaug n=1 Tax=Papilio polytes TaxID=76194 RepID=UPI0006768C03|nr:PREDICTED: protein Smaug [Papilio polytes]
MNGTFSEQLGGVAGIFDQWGTCERTVVACALARRVPWPGLKLVQRAVEAALQQHVEDDRLERDANDETLLAGLLAPRSDDDEEEGVERLQQLLGLLPLNNVKWTAVCGVATAASGELPATN